MTALADRLVLPDDLRYGWLQSNDTFLLCELNNLFKKSLCVRGAISKIKQNGAEKMALDYFQRLPELDYFICADKAPTHCGLKYVDNSRILFYRPSKSWGGAHFRKASCRYVRLKRQILTIFEEELNYSCTK